MAMAILFARKELKIIWKSDCKAEYSTQITSSIAFLINDRDSLLHFFLASFWFAFISLTVGMLAREFYNLLDVLVNAMVCGSVFVTRV